MGINNLILITIRTQLLINSIHFALTLIDIYGTINNVKKTFVPLKSWILFKDTLSSIKLIISG